MSREESPRLGLARTGELIAELGMRFRIAEHEAKRLRELLEDDGFADEVATHLTNTKNGMLGHIYRNTITAFRAALLAKIKEAEDA